MNHYEEFTDLILSVKELSKRLEGIWDKIDPITCEAVYDPLPVQHLPCDSCKVEGEDECKNYTS